MILVKQGHIVGCNFPLVEQPNIPGDERPALVLLVAEEIAPPHQRWALVAYATGQGGTAGNKKLRPDQIELQPTSQNGLSYLTVISLARTVWLRLTNEWFAGVESGGAVWGRPHQHEFQAAKEKQIQVAQCGASEQPKISGGITIGGPNPGSVSDLGLQGKPLIVKRRKITRPPAPNENE